MARPIIQKGVLLVFLLVAVCLGSILAVREGFFGRDIPLGEKCQNTYDCKTDLICINGRCTTIKKFGEECINNLDCIRNYRCKKSKCTLGEFGDACDNKEQCFSGKCPKGTCVN